MFKFSHAYFNGYGGYEHKFVGVTPSCGCCSDEQPITAIDLRDLAKEMSEAAARYTRWASLLDSYNAENIEIASRVYQNMLEFTQDFQSGVGHLRGEDCGTHGEECSKKLSELSKCAKDSASYLMSSRGIVDRDILIALYGLEKFVASINEALACK